MMLLRYAGRDAMLLEQVADGRRARNRHAPESSCPRGRFFLYDQLSDGAALATGAPKNARRSALTRSFNVEGSPCGAPL